MYNRISYGSFSPYLSPMPDISRKEFNLLIALLLPTVLFGIFPSVIIDTLDIPTTTLLYVTDTPIRNRGEILTIVNLAEYFTFLERNNIRLLIEYQLFTLIV